MMKCPRCGYVRRPDDSAPAEQCPACDVIYAKAVPPPSTLAECMDCGGKVSRLADACVHCGRPFGAAGERMTAPVSVVDVRMGFMSMVLFMVKWVIATIPALIILFMIGTTLSGLLGGAILGLSRY